MVKTPRERAAKAKVLPLTSAKQDNRNGGKELEKESNTRRSSRELQAHKIMSRTTVYQNHKNTIYTTARKNAQDVSNSGIQHLKNARARIQEFRTQETSREKFLADFKQLHTDEKKSIGSLVSMYSDLLEVAAPQRINQIEAICVTIDQNPMRRRAALDKVLKNARARLEEARSNERAASDASTLIKHYKSLLRH